MTDSKAMPEIEFWFEFGSVYSYLSVMRIENEAKKHGVKIAWKPFLLGAVFQSLGFEGSPLVAQKESAPTCSRTSRVYAVSMDCAGWSPAHFRDLGYFRFE